MLRNSKGQFLPGSMKGNQFAKGNPANKGSFRKGEHTMEKHPSWKGGIQIMKRDGVYVNIGNGKRIPRGRYNWEQVYGELPKGYIIYHKDGNNKNDAIDNLEAMTRAELITRNDPKKYGQTREI
jgi:hypothetical protein